MYLTVKSRESLKFAGNNYDIYFRQYPWFIFHQGVAVTPWVGAAFGMASLAMIGLRSIFKAKTYANSGC